MRLRVKIRQAHGGARTVSDVWTISQSVATIAAAMFAIPMIYVATKQLRIAAEAYKAAADQTSIAAKAASTAALTSMNAASRDLQWKVMEDASLRPILLPELSTHEFTAAIKQALVRGMLISQYAFVYDFHALDLVPPSTWKGYTADMHEFFSKKENLERWKQLEEYYPKEFRTFVNRDLLKRPD